ncbi:MAG: 3-dehydroquinate synthase [Pedobacter sp.]|jgi:3-dehydroquinate synthase|nr:MAG: 3-dehydroquinate synthase [Pedobacter sp.]
MKIFKASNHQIYVEDKLASLPAYIKSGNYGKVFVFVDTNTSQLCLPIFQDLMDGFSEFDVIETDAGEENKNIDFCIGIWKTLLDFQADRKSLMINLGGGVITDMGGFIASTYKRGIDFINIPTSLLAQVDASVGGKTGIDIDAVKNMVGTFALPKAVFIESAFLKTLPSRELLAGYAEMIKHALILDKAYYESLKSGNPMQIDPEWIAHSVDLKNEVVLTDPLEKGLRKILNFGHTIGHAIESFSLAHDKQPLNHGEAIAIGMIIEAYLGTKFTGLSTNDYQDIKNYISSLYPNYQVNPKHFKKLLTYMYSDKKNENGTLLFSLISSIGTCKYNIEVSENEVLQALAYHFN